MRQETGRWTTWFEVERQGWGRTTQAPWTTFLHSIARLMHSHSWTGTYQCVMELLFMGTLAGATWALIQRRLWPEAAYLAATTASLLTGGYYVSVPRTALLCFPVPVLVAGVKHHCWQRTGAVVALALLGTNTVTFLTDQWTG
jgi:hypothetical protein